jgi:hypothetical protein
MPTPNLHVDIAAAGEGSRLRPTMRGLGFPDDLPKHLLPTGNPDDETLLGRIVRQSLASPQLAAPVIYANPNNAAAIRSHPDVDPRAHITTAPADTSFGDFMRTLVGRGAITLGASGDHYAETFSWDNLLDHHGSNNYPVTIVTARCLAVDEGAVYRVTDTGQIAAFQRVGRTTPEDTINIGLYVFEPSRLVLDSLARVGVNAHTVERPMSVSPEKIVTALIEDGLVGSYELPEGTSYNVNTAETYDGLLLHTASLHDAVTTATP